MAFDPELVLRALAAGALTKRRPPAGPAGQVHPNHDEAMRQWYARHDRPAPQMGPMTPRQRTFHQEPLYHSANSPRKERRAPGLQVSGLLSHPIMELEPRHNRRS
jgi:hypothetical protein